MILYPDFWDRFQAAWSVQKMPHAWMFFGPCGVGKKSLAIQCAQAILYQEWQNPPHDNVNNHPDFFATEQTDIEHLRDVKERIDKTPLVGAWKVVLIADLQDVRAGFVQALLKILEEPPARTVFFLTSSAQSVPETILSRCMIYHCPPLSDDVMHTALMTMMPDVDVTREIVFYLAQGRIGRAIAFYQNPVFISAAQESFSLWDHAVQGPVIPSEKLILFLTEHSDLCEEWVVLWIRKRCHLAPLAFSFFLDRVQERFADARIYHIDTTFVIREIIAMMTVSSLG